MAYRVDFSNPNKSPIIVNDGELDTTTDITLLGKNYVRYGEIVAEDFLHLLEHFANDTAPTRPTEGQIWYDSYNDQLFYFDRMEEDGGQWRGIGSMTVSTNTEALPSKNLNPQNGHFWLNAAGQLHVYSAGEWKPIGQTGNTRVVARTRYDTTGTLHNTLETIVNNEIVSIYSADGGSIVDQGWTPGNADPYIEYLEDGVTLLETQFPFIRAGLTMNNSNASTDEFVFHGTATSAQYADLAERYEADAEYSAGTVVILGGKKEVTQSLMERDARVFGVLSTKPGLMLNDAAGPNNTHPHVALAGRVPCKVAGPVAKGDRLVTSDIPGYARAVKSGESVDWTHVIGRALENKADDGQGMVEIVVGVK